MNVKQRAASISAGRALRWPIVMAGMMLTMSVSLMPHANAQGDDADKILKKMFDYVAGQKTLSITFDSDIEVITSNLQKIQFTSSGQVQLSRPDKLRATRTGGYRDVEIVFDGKTLTMNNKDANDFAQIESPGSTDQLIDLLREKHGVVAPGADLLFSNAFDVMMADVIEGAQIGQGVIDGVECDHGAQHFHWGELCDRAARFRHHHSREHRNHWRFERQNRRCNDGLPSRSHCAAGGQHRRHGRRAENLHSRKRGSPEHLHHSDR